MKSKRKILERYEKSDNKYVIQISSNTFRDLFNKYDQTSSFVKRDLNYDLADYLFESASDLEGREFYVCLNLHAEKRSDQLEEIVNKGIDSYFEYESHKIQRKIKHIVIKIILHTALSMLCFSISFMLNRFINADSFLYVLFVESIVVAAWVLMWPVFSDFVYELVEIRKTRKIYRNIIEAELRFNYIQ